MRGQEEVAFWRDRVEALDDALAGLAAARQRIITATRVRMIAAMPEAGQIPKQD